MEETKITKEKQMEKDIDIVEEIETTGKSALSIYMNNVKDFEQINKDEMLELGQMLKDENKRDYAINRLVEGNLKLVIKMAHDWAGIGLSLDDLIAEGNIALYTAAQKFDISVGHSFTTYAAWWIRTQMSRAVNKAKIVRIPDASDMKKRKVNRFIEEFRSANGRDPERDEIESGVGLSRVEVKNIMTAHNNVISMNAKYDNTDSDSEEVGNSIFDGEEESVLDKIVKNEEITALYKAIEDLEERSKIIVKMRWGLCGNHQCTLDEVSAKVGKTKERVRQIEKEALRKLKDIIVNYL